MDRGTAQQQSGGGVSEEKIDPRTILLLGSWLWAHRSRWS